MTGVKRKAAAFGFSLLGTLSLLMLCGVKLSYAIAPVMIAVCVIALLRRTNAAPYLLTFTAAFVTGALLLSAANGLVYAPSLRYVGDDVFLSGTVKDFPQDHPASKGVVLKNCVIDGKTTRYSVTVYFTDGSYPLPEDTVTLTASELFCSTDEKDRFFYHTLSNGAWLSAFARGGLTVTEPESRSPLFRLKELRQQIQSKAAAHVESELAAVSSAIVTGDRTDIPDGIRTAFRKSGISHLFAVSGMHLALWTGIIFRILQKRSRIRLLPNLFVLLFIWVYAAFTGFSPSVIRAGFMLSLLCIANLIRRHADPLNSLGASATVMLVVDPWLAGNVSFLLSFIATFAIVGVLPLLYEFKSAEGKLIKEALFSKREELLLGVVVLFATIPCSAYFFGYMAALAPVMSLICTPIAELMMISSAVGAVLPSGWMLTRGVYTVSAALTNAIVKLSKGAAELKFTIIPLREGYIAVWFVITAAAILLLRYKIKTSRAVVLNVLLGIWAAALLTGIVITGMTAKDYTVYIPDTGNATMVAVTSGTGARSLVLGCGGDYDVFADCRDLLQSKAVFTPDFVVVPRNGKTESANLNRLLKGIPPDNLLLPMNAQTGKNLPEHTVYTDAFDGELFPGLHLSYETREDFCAGVMTVNGVKLVFCLYPASDFTGRDETYLSGDYLICRGMIPVTLDAARFGSVVVLSDKSAEALGLPENAVSTADTGGITLLFKHHSS